MVVDGVGEGVDESGGNDEGYRSGSASGLELGLAVMKIPEAGHGDGLLAFEK